MLLRERASQPRGRFSLPSLGLVKIMYLDRSPAALQHAEADPAFLIKGRDLDPDQHPSGSDRIRQEAGMQGKKPAFETDPQLRG